MTPHKIYLSDQEQAARIVAKARDSLVASGAEIGETVAVPWEDSATITAFREDRKIRFEIVRRGGSFAQHTFHSATQVLAGVRAGFFGN